MYQNDTANLTERILHFLARQGWAIFNETKEFMYLKPSPEIIANRDYFLKIPIYNDSKDYPFLIEKVIDNLEVIYGNKHQRQLKSFREKKVLSGKKYLSKDNWIAPEQKSKIDKIGIYDIFIPDH